MPDLLFPTIFGTKDGETEIQRVEATLAVSVSDLKKSPTPVMGEAKGATVAVLNHNRVMAYMVPAGLYEALLERLDDRAFEDLARERLAEVGHPVDIDAL